MQPMVAMEKDVVPGKKMIKGLFFDGVDVSSYDFPVDMGIKLAFPVLPHAASTEFRVDNIAAMATEETRDLLLRKSLVEHGFFHHFLYI